MSNPTIHTSLTDWRAAGGDIVSEDHPKKLSVSVEAKDDQILVETEHGQIVSIELEAGKVRVHTYAPGYEAPYNVDIPADGPPEGDSRDLEASIADMHKRP